MPVPPSMLSKPLPPERKSLPDSPKMWSWSAPPWMMSLRAWPKIVSFPPRPVITSASMVPVSRSPSAVPDNIAIAVPLLPGMLRTQARRSRLAPTSKVIDCADLARSGGRFLPSPGRRPVVPRRAARCRSLRIRPSGSYTGATEIAIPAPLPEFFCERRAARAPPVQESRQGLVWWI